MSRRGKVWQRGRKAGEPARKGIPWYFVVDVSAPGGERQQVWRGGFATQAAAQAALSELVTDVQQGTYIEPTKETVGSYLTGWLVTLPAQGRKPTTVASYRQWIEHHVIPKVGGIELQALTALDLDRLYADMLANGRRDGGGGLSARSVRYAATIVGKALHDAERKGIVRRNVARLASPPSASAARAPEAATWTPNELHTFLEATEDHHHGALFRLGAMTGMRRGELCGLRWSDVDLDGNRLTVRHTITTVDHKPVEGGVKSARSRRSIDLDAGTVAVLRQHRKTQLEGRLLMGSGYTDRGLVFAMPDGAPWNPDTIGQAFERTVERSKLSRITLHGLRHSHASHMLAAGVNVKVVSERLGHASVSFTLDVYGHVMPGQQADAAAAVAILVDGAP